MIFKRNHFGSAVLTLSLFALLAGCGGGSATDGGGEAAQVALLTEAERKPTRTSYYTGPTAFEKYVQKFVSNARARGVDVTPHMKKPKLVMRIASLDSYGPTTIGLCQSSATTRRVTIDPDFWNSASAASREQVIHHELGHCVLDRRHLATKLSSGIPKSMMYPSILNNGTYTSNRARYLKELFTSPLRGWDADADTRTVASMNDADMPGALEDICSISPAEIL